MLNYGRRSSKRIRQTDGEYHLSVRLRRMKTTIKLVLLIMVLSGIGAAAYKPAVQYWEDRNRPEWRQAEVKQGRITSVVNATGEIKPVLSVLVGCFVSGPVVELHANFNDEVKKGQLLAKIDPRIYDAAVARDRATLNTRLAEVKRAEAQLQQATNDEKRALALYEENKDFISRAELDQFKFNRMSLDAQLDVAKMAVKQAEANLENSATNLEYTNITSPVDGIVIHRKIDTGQTLAAQFQTPELFVIAPQMREIMHIYASVDEADIGLIRKAADEDQPVRFTVDGYPDDLFEGTIEQVRFSSTTTQNVVTYPVIVAAANLDLKLLPGMTANISFQVAERKDVLKVPNAALRFYPDREYVRKEDRKVLDGSDRSEDEEGTPESMLSADERAAVRQKRNRRHVWLVEDRFLRATEVVIGLNDNKFTELVSGELKSSQKLVTGTKIRDED